ncbi:MAG: Sec-independent protein translocase protein TatB [Cellvibrionaceae bacterium]|nr:Sec-independent protein translocase protein TatB [Cellvibrionaceae bacterium]
MGFFEILVIAIIALIVVGPARMPDAVRTVALTIGRLKRSVNSARSEIEKHIGADDIRRQLHNEAVMASLKNVQQNLAELDTTSPENNLQHQSIGQHDPHINQRTTTRDTSPEADTPTSAPHTQPHSKL